MIGDLMGRRDRGDLETAFGDNDLRAHFRFAHPAYVKWRDDGCNKKVTLVGGKEYSLKTKETFLHVRGNSLDWDDTLEGLMTRTKIPDEIGLNYHRVADIFALHVTADMPLPPK